MYLENLSISAVKANMFDKRTVVELNEGQMVEIDGGTLGEAAAALAIIYAGYQFGHWLREQLS
jgi:uncharacterized protein YdiU (UPF0061 family)